MATATDPWSSASGELMDESWLERSLKASGEQQMGSLGSIATSPGWVGFLSTTGERFMHIRCHAPRWVARCQLSEVISGFVTQAATARKIVRQIVARIDEWCGRVASVRCDGGGRCFGWVRFAKIQRLRARRRDKCPV